MLDKPKKLGRNFSTTKVEQRREVRVEIADATAEIAGQRYPIKNWSAHGFCVGPCSMTPNPGDRLDIKFFIPLPEQRLEFECRTGVMRHDWERQEFGGVFFDLDKDLQDVIDEHFQVFSASRYGKDLLQDLESPLKRE